MALVLDAGALLALERSDRHLMVRLKEEATYRRIPSTHGGVVAQVWRGGSGRQANLSRSMAGIDVAALDNELGKKAGVLLGLAKASDAIDAALVLLADDGDQIYTSDPEDLEALASAAGIHIELIPL